LPQFWNRAALGFRPSPKIFALFDLPARLLRQSGGSLFCRRRERFLLNTPLVKPGHSPALVLVGWFLITAPVTNHGAIIYQDAPLSQWNKMSHFDSESDCDSARKDLIQDSQDQVELAPDSVADADTKENANNSLNEALASQCVDDKDPQLQGTKLPKLAGPSSIQGPTR
jgi:hypothetical protein